MPETFHGIELLPNTLPPKQLYILLHGVGSYPADLVPLARKLQGHYPEAAFLLPDGIQPFEGSDYRRQWFPVTGITEENRPARVAEAILPLYEIVKRAQDRLNVLPPDTALVGFSQGSILALEFSKAYDGSVGRVIAFSGRYATLPEQAPLLTTIHLLHGESDRVIPVAHAHAAYEWLSTLRGDVTIDIASSVGHELHDALIDRAIMRLETCVPLRSWERALGIK